MVLGSGQYLFWFRIVKSKFEYQMKSIHYQKLRAPLRSIVWSWTDSNALKPAYEQVKDSKKHVQAVAQLVLADAEDGLSLYTLDFSTNTLKLRGFDIGLKQLVYGSSLPSSGTLACLDYRGVFSLLEDI